MKRAAHHLTLVERHGRGNLTITQHDGDTGRPVAARGNLRLTRSQVSQLVEWLSADPADDT